WMVAMAMVYSTVAASVGSTLAAGRASPEPAFLALAPAFGLGVGALFAAFLEASAGRVLLVTGPPLGIGATVFWLATAVTRDFRAGAISGLVGMGASLVAALLLSMAAEPPRVQQKEESAFLRILPAPWVASGREGTSMGLAARGAF